MKKLLLWLVTAAVAMMLMTPAAEAKTHHKKHHKRHHRHHHTSQHTPPPAGPQR